MMPQFGERSTRNLSECHADLQRLFNEVIKHWDCAVIEGHRPKEEQDAAFHSGRSKLRFPASKHNSKPSLAADVVSWPVNWKNMRQFTMFAGFVKGVAASMGIEIRCGADWDGDGDPTDQSFHDLPHFELL